MAVQSIAVVTGGASGIGRACRPQRPPQRCHVDTAGRLEIPPDLRPECTFASLNGGSIEISR
jgi:hypothetical protein